MFRSRTISYRILALCLIVPLIASGCDLFGEESADDREAREARETAAAAFASAAAQQPAGEPSATGVGQVLGEGEIMTFTPTATDTPAPTLTPSPTTTPTPDATQLALAACLAEIIALTKCVNDAELPIIYTDSTPNHQIVNNGDPTTLYRSPDILAMLNAPGVTMVHNYFARPDTCPLGTACVLHTLMIEFPGQSDALTFFDRVTQTGMPDEVVIAAPNAAVWDASKCATGFRDSAAAGAPPFAVIYCSVSLGGLHWGFNLSSYESLPEGFVDVDLGAILTTAYDYLSAGQSAPAGNAPLEIRWLTGLGSGAQTVVDDFNASQSDVLLVVDVADPNIVLDILTSQIASGTPPDIVGPLPISGTAAFHSQWLDLQSLIESTSYDLNQFPAESVDFYNASGEGQIGLPFAIFPSVVFFNRDLFDEAGLNYPPQSYGDTYILPDGAEAEWNYDTLAQVAQLLTLDASGNDALDPGFDPSNIVQYGYTPQNQDLFAIGSSFGALTLISPDGATIAIPEPAIDAWHWIYDGIWTHHFIPDQAAIDSAPFGSGNSFNSGNVAMAQAPLWYTCCLGDAGGNWDLAPVPSHNGQTFVNLDASTFHILGSTQHPEEAFQVLTYLLGDAAPDLLDLSGGLPARTNLQAGYITGLEAQFPQGVNWQVTVDGITFAGSLTTQGYVPNYDAALERADIFLEELLTTDGLDLDAAIAALEADLQTLIAED